MQQNLKHGRIMSMFNEDCICKAKKEIKDKDYEKAEIEMEEVKKGNLNYKGIGR